MQMERQKKPKDLPSPPPPDPFLLIAEASFDSSILQLQQSQSGAVTTAKLGLCRTARGTGKRIELYNQSESFDHQCNFSDVVQSFPVVSRSIFSPRLLTRGFSISENQHLCLQSRFLDGGDSVSLAFSCRCHILLRGSESINASQRGGNEF